MRSVIKHFVFIALFIASAMVVCSCSDVDDEFQVTVPSKSTITQQGGVITALNGNVTLSFPEGAVSSPVEFNINLCLDELEQNYMLRPIRIDPVMLFNMPVTVTLRYDETLALNPDELPEDICLMASLWRSEMEFYLHQPCATCDCSVDYEAKTISFCICNSGIITIEPIDINLRD